MSRVKDWMIDMENLVVEAIENGAKTEQEVLAYVGTHVPADRQYVHQVLELFYGPFEAVETFPEEVNFSLDDCLPF